jgi:hypothetical protein
MRCLPSAMPVTRRALGGRRDVLIELSLRAQSNPKLREELSKLELVPTTPACLRNRAPVASDIDPCSTGSVALLGSPSSSRMR